MRECSGEGYKVVLSGGADIIPHKVVQTFDSEYEIFV